MPAVRPTRWAQPLKRSGLPNLYQVDTNLYRGAQPDAAGVRELQKLGVKTILNLRSSHSDHDLLSGAGIREVRLPVYASKLTQADLETALKTMLDPDATPVFVHCRHGADRTGAVCAAYRVVVQGWTREDAVDELRNGGYHFHFIFRSIPRLIRDFDATAVRRRVGLAQQPLPTKPTSTQ